MSVEEDYSNSYKDGDYLIPIIQGLAIHLDWQLQKIKSDLNANFTNNEFDIEYVQLYLAELELEIQTLLYKKLVVIQTLSEEKLKDFDDSDDTH